MSVTGSVLPNRWRFGLHPHAVGSMIRSFGRVELPIGEAFRIEMTSPDADPDTIELQYYISTEAGGWALWLSCPSRDLAGLEAAIQDIKAPFAT